MPSETSRTFTIGGLGVARFIIVKNHIVRQAREKSRVFIRSRYILADKEIRKKTSVVRSLHTFFISRSLNFSLQNFVINSGPKLTENVLAFAFSLYRNIMLQEKKPDI